MSKGLGDPSPPRGRGDRLGVGAAHPLQRTAGATERDEQELPARAGFTPGRSGSSGSSAAAAIAEHKEGSGQGEGGGDHSKGGRHKG